MNKKARIESKMNGLVITMSEGEYKTKINSLIVTSYTNSKKQNWTLAKSEGQNFYIRNVLNPMFVIDVQNASKEIYSGILCYKFHGNDNQLWKIKNYKDSQNPNEKGFFYIQNVKSGLVLEIEGGINYEGIRVVQNKEYNGNKNQLWSLKFEES